MDIIKTSSGRTFDCDYLAAIPYPPMMFFRILNCPIDVVAGVFYNKEETKQIWYGEQRFDNYTKLVSIIPEPDAIKVSLSTE